MVDIRETSQLSTVPDLTQYKKCVIGLDRDGVINVDRGTYTYRPVDFEPIPGSIEAIARLRNAGHKIVIITNQGGIEKGLYTVDDVEAVHDYMFQLLGDAGCSSIDAIYYSTSSRKNDMFAKPNLGMFKRCQKENPHIKFNSGFFVGDKISDMKAAVKIGARPILVRTGYGLNTERELNKFTYRSIAKKVSVVDTLSALADAIT
jgi:D-glycero-D-manno-heptose 1,7-bisphosphate phosphatase|tara:strand:- start:11470 stop:12081 length:612 start_codon:yes stop_codon:yes gene_type:complete